MKKIVQTILVILVMATVLVLLGGRALAGPLEPIVEYPPIAKSKLLMSCENLRADIADVRLAFMEKHDQMSTHLTSVTKAFAEWSQILRPYEGTKVIFVEGYFSPLPVSTVRLGLASDAIYSEGDVVDQVVGRLKEIVELCALQEQKEQLLRHLEQFSKWENGHFSTTASFYATMQGRLGDWSDVWAGIVGNEFDVPVDFFLSLETAANQFGEATELVRQNGELALKPFDDFSALIAP